MSRVAEGLIKEARKKDLVPESATFGYVSVITWGIVMFLFERDKAVLQRSLSSSMTFLYHDSDKPLESVLDLVPLNLPRSITNPSQTQGAPFQLMKTLSLNAMISNPNNSANPIASSS